jgi:hypothetical protein
VPQQDGFEALIEHCCSEQFQLACSEGFRDCQRSFSETEEISDASSNIANTDEAAPKAVSSQHNLRDRRFLAGDKTIDNHLTANKSLLLVLIESEITECFCLSGLRLPTRIWNLG